jgi:hypothetical protein
MVNELGTDSDSWDIMMHLKGRENDPDKKNLLSQRYAEILLIFDFEPQDPLFDEIKIREMVGLFSDSTQMGKLYINYPMVEAFYHMKSIPDPEYNTYTVSIAELNAKPRDNGYKARVDRENRSVERANFTSDKRNADMVIRQNIDKAWAILESEAVVGVPPASEILESQLAKLTSEQAVDVLCTCVFYIIDYNPTLIC